MPLNVPDVDRDNISFGPARLFLGPAGTTPTVDVGAIVTDDGVTVEVTGTQRTITQGNPKLIDYVFTQEQGVMVTLSGIEWNFENFAQVLGAGNTSVTAAQSRFAFGGEPCVTELALHVQHQMCRTGNTMNVYVWRATGNGTTTMPFIHDEHAFPYEFMGLRADTDWAGNSLPYDEQLFAIVEEL